MQDREIFTTTVSYFNQSTFRNVLQKKGVDAFYDLIDPQDADLSLNDATLAEKAINNVRPAITPQSAHYLAIDSVFDRKRFYPTRYGDGTYPVWYGSLAKETSIHETAFHMAKNESGQPGVSEIIERPRLIFNVDCTGILINLVIQKPFFPQLTDLNNYDFTHRIGKQLQNYGYPGLISPSARHQGGTNLAIFSPKFLSNARLYEQIFYQFNPTSLHLTVLDQNRQNILQIDYSQQI